MSILTEYKTDIMLTTSLTRRRSHKNRILTDRSISEASSVAEAIDSDELIRQISNFIKRESRLEVQEMRVCFENGCLTLHGYCRTFYAKQVAQHAALTILGNIELVNDIRVLNHDAG